MEWVAISFSRGSSRPRERVGFCRASGSVRNLSFIWWGLVAWGGFRQRCGHLGKSCEGEGWSSREEGKAFNSKLVITFCFYLLLLLSHFSRVRLCATPSMAAHQAPPSLGFSRQEHWSGLPFPSPMHESESEVAQSYLTLSDPMDCSLPGCSVHGICQARVLEWSAIAFSLV